MKWKNRKYIQFISTFHILQLVTGSIMYGTLLFSETTKPVRLFSLRYGSGFQNIGLQFVSHPNPGMPLEGDEVRENSFGPSDFAIGFDKSIYIADTINGKIKKFSMKGKLLFSTSDTISGLEGICVDPQGRILALQRLNAVHNILIFNSIGEKAQIAEISFPADEKNSMSTKFKCFSTSKGYVFLCAQGFYYKIEPGFRSIKRIEGSPYLLSHDLSYSYKVGVSDKRETVQIFHIDGSESKVNLHVLQPIYISVLNEAGGEIKKITIPAKDFTEEEKKYPVNLDVLRSDERGHFYLLRQPLTIRWISLRKDKLFGVLQSAAVLEYDADGEFVGVRAILEEFGPEFKVDPEGNIYYLDFKSDHVDVMMAPAPKKGAKRNK